MDWQNIIITIVSAVATALASWIVTKVTTLINTKVKNGKSQAYLTAAVSIVSSVVKATYQTYIESIKGTEAWTAEAQQQALTNSVTTAKTQLSREVQEYITRTFGDVDRWLQTQIEASIYDLKK